MPTYLLDIAPPQEEDVHALLRGGYEVDFRLGYLLETEYMVMMTVRLAGSGSFLDDAVGLYDLRFGIQYAPLDAPHRRSGLNYDRAHVRRCIPKDKRRAVSEMIDLCLYLLFDAAKPMQITMSTYDAELPEPALVKYRRIEVILNSLGLLTKSAEKGSDGTHYWHFVA